MILAKQKLQQASPVSGKLWMIPASLSHNAGIVTALIGSTTYSCTLSGLVANTRYQLYVVPGSTTLQFSTRENSLGPLGFSSWILIGSFYSNGLSSVSFGSFINIDGIPKTANAVVTQVTWSITGFSIQPVLTWERNGRTWAFTTGFQKDGSAGVGAVGLKLDLPANIPNTITPSSTLNTANELTQINGGNIGFITFSSLTGAVADWTAVEMYSITNGFNFLTQPTGTGSLQNTSVLANSIAQGFLRPTPMSGWLDTPLKDL